MSNSRTCVRIRGALRGLESQEDAATDLRGIFNRLEPGSERLPRVVAEVVVCCSSRNHERVIFQYAVGENDLAICQIEVARLGQQHTGVLLPFQHGAKRCRDVCRREPPRGHLVEQRLEEVKVPSVDERDIDRHATQAPRNTQPGETAANDHDAMWMHHASALARSGNAPKRNGLF